MSRQANGMPHAYPRALDGVACHAPHLVRETLEAADPYDVPRLR